MHMENTWRNREEHKTARRSFFFFLKFVENVLGNGLFLNKHIIISIHRSIISYSRDKSSDQFNTILCKIKLKHTPIPDQSLSYN